MSTADRTDGTRRHAQTTTPAGLDGWADAFEAWLHEQPASEQDALRADVAARLARREVTA